ncbi:hypothetical protein HA402_001133 [Bradysia odoriphaga]|nr:hypothetical protein HA402_001133 [Bradysia odoriphaga]
MDVMMNENNLYSNMVSAKNPSPLCLPFPLPPPIQVALNIEMCVKLFNIFTPGNNLHMCMDMQMKVQKAPIIVLHFDCMRMGQDGVAIVKPDQNGGLEVNTEGVSPENPDVVDTVDTVPQTQVTQPGEPPQTDYDIYDEVTEVKIKN